MENTGTFKTTLVAGKLVRKQVRIFLEDLAFNLDLELDLEEGAWFFESHFRIKVKGPVSALVRFQKEIESKMEAE